MSTRTSSILGTVAATAAVGIATIFGGHAAFAQSDATNAQQPAAQMSSQTTNTAPTSVNITSVTTTTVPIAPNGTLVPGQATSVTTTTPTMVAPTAATGEPASVSTMSVGPTQTVTPNYGGPTSVTTTSEPVTADGVPVVGTPSSITTTTVTYGSLPIVTDWRGHLTRALIDLRDARGYINMPDKFDMTDDEFNAAHHISDAIKESEDNGIYDGYRPYFTPSESVTLSESQRLLEAKKLVERAKVELNDPSTAGNTTASDMLSDADAAKRSIDKAIAANDWNQTLTNDRQFMWNDPNWSTD